MKTVWNVVSGASQEPHRHLSPTALEGFWTQRWLFGNLDFALVNRTRSLEMQHPLLSVSLARGNIFQHNFPFLVTPVFLFSHLNATNKTSKEEEE